MALALKQQPQTFQRGNERFSTSRTRKPRRAQSKAARPPATPAPITITSQLFGISVGSPTQQITLWPGLLQDRSVQTSLRRELEDLPGSEGCLDRQGAIVVNDPGAAE